MIDLNDLMKNTYYAVEANNFEQMFLYTQNQRKNKWDEIQSGAHITLGHIDERPICVLLNWALINEFPVLFYEPVSVLVDYVIIDEWLKSLNLRQSTDSATFGNILTNMKYLRQEIGCISEDCWVERNENHTRIQLYDFEGGIKKFIKDFSPLYERPYTDKEIFEWVDSENATLIKEWLSKNDK